MKTIICEVLNQNSEIEHLIKAVASNNAGNVPITPEDVSHYMKVRTAIWPGLPQYVNIDGDTVTISDYKGDYLVLTWKEKKEDTPHEAHALALTDNIS
jgi:hypothetical protein